MTKHIDIDAGQRLALQAYAKAHGRTWKQALRYDWQHSTYRWVASEHHASLQQVRNVFGTEWLAIFKLKG